MQDLFQEDEGSVIVNWFITNFVAYKTKFNSWGTLCGKIQYKWSMVNSQRQTAEENNKSIAVIVTLSMIESIIEQFVWI